MPHPHDWPPIVRWLTGLFSAIVLIGVTGLVAHVRSPGHGVIIERHAGDMSLLRERLDLQHAGLSAQLTALTGEVRRLGASDSGNTEAAHDLFDRQLVEILSRLRRIEEE